MGKSSRVSTNLLKNALALSASAPFAARSNFSQVAIKILEKHKIKEKADVERVAREIHILKMIRHPHIVQLYEVRNVVGRVEC